MKRLCIYLFLLLSSGLYFDLEAQQLNLRIPDTTIATGAVFNLPVYVDSNLTGRNISSYQLQIEFSASYLEFMSIVLEGTLTQTSSFATSFSSPEPGRLNISAAGANSMSGKGVLVYIKLKAIQNNYYAYVRFKEDSRNFFNQGDSRIIFKNSQINILSTPTPTITISPNMEILTAGETLQFRVSGGKAPYQWFLTNPAVASIDSSGLMKTKNRGFTRVFVRDSQGLIDTTDNQIEIRALRLSIPDSSLYSNTTFDLPIYVSDVTGMNITSGSFALNYVKDVITVLDVIPTGTLLSSFSKPQYTISDGKIAVAFAAATPLSNRGILLFVRMKLSQTSGGASNITISDALFNQDLQAVIKNGYISKIYISPPNITPNSAILFVGDTLRFSGSSGLPPYKFSTTDTNIAVIGPNGLLQTKRSGTVKVLLTDSIFNSAATSNIEIYNSKVYIKDAYAVVGRTFTFPIYFENVLTSNPISSFEIRINYDSKFLKLAGYQTDGTLTNGWTISTNSTDNLITIAGAHTSSFSNKGVLINVLLQELPSVTEGQYTNLSFSSVSFNEGFPRAYCTGAKIYATIINVGVERILAPPGVVNLNEEITPAAIVKNTGISTETFPVTFKIGSDYSDSVIVTLRPGKMDTTKFKKWTAVRLGTHVVSCSTAAPAYDYYKSDDIKKGTVAVSNKGGPEIYTISPAKGGNTGFVTAEISGSRFQPGAMVKLSKKNEADIVVDSSVTQILDSSKIITTFDLRHKELGKWDLIITNPDSTTSKFYDGFTIEIGNEHISIDIIGRNNIRAGRKESYWVCINNLGNIDIYDLYITIKIPKNIDCDVLLPQLKIAIDDTTWPDFPEGVLLDNQQFVIPIWLYKISNMSDCKIPITITPSGNYIQNSFYLNVEITHSTHSLFWNGGDFRYINSTLIFLSGMSTIKEIIASKLIKNAADDIDWNKVEKTCIEFINKELIHFKEPSGVWDWLKIIWEAFWDAIIGKLPGGGLVNKKLPAAGAGLILYIKHLNDLDKLLWENEGMSIPLEKYDGQVSITRACEPSYKESFSGVGINHYILTKKILPYIIFFDNVDSATAAAQEVWIVDTLSVNVDWSSVSFGEMKVGDKSISFTESGTDVNTSLQLTDSTEVKINGKIDVNKGIVQWYFRGTDKRTGDYADFLPPNKVSPQGEGHVSFNIKQKPELTSGTQIKNEAWIIFDVNPPMSTGEVLNTIDALPPTSHILPLYKEQPSTGFQIYLSGDDENFGSGIESYSIYVSDNGGPFTQWLTTDTISVIYNKGEVGHTYQFYSIARDHVGNVELPPDSFDVGVIVVPPAAVEEPKELPRKFSLSQNYPNPFNPTTTIRFDVPKIANVTIKIYDILGREVRTLINRKLNAGSYEEIWDGKNNRRIPVASGIYLLRLQAKDFVSVKKMVLLK